MPLAGLLLVTSLALSCATSRGGRAQLAPADDAVAGATATARQYTDRRRCGTLSTMTVGSLLRSIFGLCPPVHFVSVTVYGLPAPRELDPRFRRYSAWYRDRGDDRWRGLGVFSAYDAANRGAAPTPHSANVRRSVDALHRPREFIVVVKEEARLGPDPGSHIVLRGEIR